MPKQPDNDSAPDPKETHSVFHDDENIQDEQEEFDSANSKMTAKQAVDAITRLMAKKEAEEKRVTPAASNRGHPCSR